MPIIDLTIGSRASHVSKTALGHLKIISKDSMAALILGLSVHVRHSMVPGSMDSTRNLKVLINQYRLSAIRGDSAAMRRISHELIKPRPELEARLEHSELALLVRLRGQKESTARTTASAVLGQEKNHNDQGLTSDSQLTERQQQIKAFVESREVRHLVHFTQAIDVTSILRHGLLSRAAMDWMKIAYNQTDQFRLDGHRDASCLSISFPNHKMFSRKRQRLTYSGPWAVLQIDPSVLWELDCAFYYTNAANHCFQTVQLSQLKTVAALGSMFGDVGRLQRNKMPGMKIYWTTDPQAEVLVFDRVAPRYITRIFLEEQEPDKRFLEMWGPTLYGVCRSYFRRR